MSEASPAPLETSRAWAQRITMVGAVLAGLTWLLSLVVSAGWADTLAGFFVGVMCVGGVAMGVLYVVHLTRQRR